MPYLRQKVRVCYYEPEEPNFDDYVYCEECSDYVYEYCSIHGSLLVIPDDKVPVAHEFPDYVHQAALTIPHEFLHLAPSIIPGAGLGVYTTLTLPRGVRFGPYRGLRKNSIDSTYCWQVYNKHRRPSHIVDAIDVNHSNWMRYVNCSRHWKEQNLVAYQYQGEIYYRTIKIIPRFTELLVFYGSEFANKLGIDLRIYNDIKYYPRILSNALQRKSPKVTNKIRRVSGIPVVNNISTLKFEKIGEIVEDSEEENRIIELEDDRSSHISDANSNVQNSTRDETENKCDLCQKIFTKRNGFHRHMRRIHKLDYFACSHCGYRVYNKIKLIDHISKCSKNIIKPTQIKCSNCHKTFSTLRHLRLHIRTVHSDLVPFACNLCNYTTKYRSSLRRHKFIHSSGFQNDLKTNSVISKCDISLSENNISVSMKKKARKNYYSQPRCCNLCDFTTISVSSYRTHREKHEGKIYQCALCDYCSNIRNLFTRHIKKWKH